MNPFHQPSCTELIQRLADGELSDAERSELLQKIDDETPERWRDVALCLLGNRLITEGLLNAAPATGNASNTPPTNAIPFPIWNRLGALAAALVLGLGLGFVVPRQQPSAPAMLFASVDDFKKAVGDALMQGGGGGGMIAPQGGSDEPTDDSPLALQPQPRPFASAEAVIGGPPAPRMADLSQPVTSASSGGTKRPGPARPTPLAPEEDASGKRASQLAEIEQHLTDIRRLLDAMK
jgi:hypothetical protein